METIRAVSDTVSPMHTLRQLQSGQQYLFCSMPDATRALETTEMIWRSLSNGRLKMATIILLFFCVLTNFRLECEKGHNVTVSLGHKITCCSWL